MILIISGTFGMVKGSQVIPVTEKDGPISLGAELENRLVKEGVAKFVGNPHENTDIPADEEPLPYHMGMKLSELKKAAESYGISTDGMTKAEILDAIEEAELEADGEEYEKPPELSAEDIEDEA